MSVLEVALLCHCIALLEVEVVVLTHSVAKDAPRSHRTFRAGAAQLHRSNGVAVRVRGGTVSELGCTIGRRERVALVAAHVADEATGNESQRIRLAAVRTVQQRSVVFSDGHARGGCL